MIWGKTHDAGFGRFPYSFNKNLAPLAFSFCPASYVVDGLRCCSSLDYS
jgi:hypothetical protein